MTNSLEALFCHVDDFWKIFEPKWRQILRLFGGHEMGVSLPIPD